MSKFDKFFGRPTQIGQASRLLLVLAIVVLVAVVIVFLVIRMAEKPAKPTTQTPTTPTVPLPVYEQTLNDIRFVFESAIDRGNILKPSDITNKNYLYEQISITTGEKFIQVTVGAQNKGLVNTSQGAWDIEDIVDSEGRNFVPLDYGANPWLPTLNFCGALLKPAFDPTPCTKLYEVSKQSAGMKIRVKTGKESTLLDLIVK